MKKHITIDGCEAAAHIAFRTNEVIAIYPITPSSGMGELSDAWAAAGQKNVWGTVPIVSELQSEGGASGTCHGAIQTGALTTTFTASQGLLLMIPNMFKIAGELTPTVFHISARTVAAHALSIFGDHSDAMAIRNTGWGMLFSNSIQEVMDFALISQAATLRSRIPFLHAFDGFRTSHEVSKIELISDDEIRSMIDDQLVSEHRKRALSPDHPVIRGTAQNPDVFFQARETVNPYYNACPGIVQQVMDQFAKICGRRYKLFDYVGDPDAERVVVLMGSGAETAHETVEYFQAKGQKIGVIKVRLYRPFAVEAFLSVLPKNVKAIAVLDRTKEPGAIGEPLYQDVVTAIAEGLSTGKCGFKTMPKIFGGRYGLSSKEFTPSMVKAVFDEAAKEKPKNHFTIGINDDVTKTSLDYDPNFIVEQPGMKSSVFWGLGADGTVGANKNSIKIIGEQTPNHAQGYFVYDSKKAGAVTVSHLRFGPNPIRSTYLVQKADFVAVHQFGLLFRYPVLRGVAKGGTFLLNSAYPADQVWDKMPKSIQEEIISKELKFYVMDAFAVAKKTNMGVRINTIMQTAFFALSGVIPKDEAIKKIRETIEKTYGKRGEAVVKQNFDAVDQALAHLVEVKTPKTATSKLKMIDAVPPESPEFVKTVTGEIIAGRGDNIPVSLFPVDGTFPTATTMWEKRCIALETPVWEPDLCIQCGRCNMVCPHACIRAKVMEAPDVEKAPANFRTAAIKTSTTNQRFTIKVSQADCTGCELCAEICPSKDKSNPSRKALNMTPMPEDLTENNNHWKYFLSLSETPKTKEPLKYNSLKDIQFLQPYFEYSGACTGCGETPYVKMASQLFGDRMIVANATGCSSIYGGNLPTTPWCKDKTGRGPAWNNSLFEDNAEFGLGMRLAVDSQRDQAHMLLKELEGKIGTQMVQGLLNTGNLQDRVNLAQKRELLVQLQKKLSGDSDPKAKRLLELSDVLIDRSIWMMGGDGWAYDIGYGGLDHVLASGKNVNVLVLDTEVYSNTGGQASKASARGSVAKFASGGKLLPKKDMGRIFMNYGNIYVAAIAMGANPQQMINAFLEAEAYPGPSIIISNSHCIAHGITMKKGMAHQKMAVDSGYWPLYRYNPELKKQGKNPFQLDSKAPSLPLKEYLYKETRYSMLAKSDPQAAEELLKLAEQDVKERWAALELLTKAGPA